MNDNTYHVLRTVFGMRCYAIRKIQWWQNVEKLLVRLLYPFNQIIPLGIYSN